LCAQVVKEVPQPIEKVQYREVPVPVEVVVERVVEKIVIKEVPVEKVLHSLRLFPLLSFKHVKCRLFIKNCPSTH
jgi:hypothetical protein